jgi:hypothetical protein
VRYVYEEPTVEMNGRPPETALTTADLGSVSPSLLSELAEAIERIDLAQMDEVIDQIREEEPETAVKLQHLITQFDYDTILQAIEETKALST